MTRRIANALLGFAVGIFTLPLAAAAWPFVAAWFMWHETDEDGEDGEGRL